MASTNLAIHISPDANPVSILALIDVLAQHKSTVWPTVQELLEFAEAQGVGSRTEIQFTATQLGLLERTEKGIGISPQGLALSAIKEEVRGDILHFLMYTRWQEKAPLVFLPSWSYKTGCDTYWRAGRIDLTSQFLDRQVEEIINIAEATFTELGVRQFEKISFSRKSLHGLHRWLEALQPPVLEENTFSRRAFCPPELLLLAIGYAVQDEDAAVEMDILLSRQKREAICRLCLLEPEALDRALDWMLPIFPHVISPGTSAGFYGRFIRLHKLPTLADVVR